MNRHPVATERNQRPEQRSMLRAVGALYFVLKRGCGHWRAASLAKGKRGSIETSGARQTDQVRRVGKERPASPADQPCNVHHAIQHEQVRANQCRRRANPNIPAKAHVVVNPIRWTVVSDAVRAHGRISRFRYPPPHRRFPYSDLACVVDREAQ